MHTRVWRIPGFGAENASALFQDFLLISFSFERSRAISKPAPNPGTHQTPVETLSERSSQLLLSKPPRNQEWSRQTKPKKGQFMNFSQGHSGTKVQCEPCFS